MQRRRYVLCSAPLLVSVLLTGCGSSTAPPAAQKEAPASAGKLDRQDAAFDALVAPDARIEKVATGFQFTEGPLAMADGSLLFSDVPGNVIYKLPAGGGQASVWLDKAGSDEAPNGGFIGSNGLSTDKAGSVVICMHGRGQVVSQDAAGKQTVLAAKYQGKRLNSPNDLAWRKNGDVYFTDPPYGFPKQDDDPKKELKFNGIYRLRNGKLDLLYKDMTRPNGIAFTPDEKFLYVANSDPAKKLWNKFPVKEDGTLGAPVVLADVTAETADGLPDGLKIDKAGNLFATGPGGVWVYNLEGKLLGKIQPEEVPANVGFADDGKTLYMTARTSVYRIRLNTAGTLPGEFWK
jgi:gluconolactonase